MPNLRPNGARLNAALQTYLSSASHYMRSGLAKSTLKTYDSAWYYFSSFCAAFSVAVSPINIPIVCAFVVHCYESRKMQPSSIKTLVAGIQFHLRCMDPSVGSLLGDPSLRLLFNGLMKRSPESIDKRLPLTIVLIRKLVSHLRQGCFNPYTDSLLEAVFLTAFYGFLRCGEYTTRTENFDPSLDLTYSNLSFGSQYFIIHLKRSKTDKNAKGTPIIIAQTGTVFCPFSSMTRYLRWRPHASPDDPLFVTDKGKAMTRSWFAARLRLVCQSCDLSPELYTAHSFRIGASTTAATLAPVSTLKAMGRWSSDAYERYIRPGVDEIISVQKAMSSAA